MTRKNGRNRALAQNIEADSKNALDKLNRAFDIPQSSLLGNTQIELSGNREAIVDGCHGILEYDENTIKLAAGKMSVRFIGRGLQIKVLTPDSAVIEGFISNIEFIS